MKTYTVTSKKPRPHNLYRFQGRNAKRDAERFLTHYIRETGDSSARITTEIHP